MGLIVPARPGASCAICQVYDYIKIPLEIVCRLWYGKSMKKTWYIEAYTQNGAVYCRECVAETLDDESFLDPYTNDEVDSFTPIFNDQIDGFSDGLSCEYCFTEIYEGN